MLGVGGEAEAEARSLRGEVGLAAGEVAEDVQPHQLVVQGFQLGPWKQLLLYDDAARSVRLRQFLPLYLFRRVIFPFRDR